MTFDLESAKTRREYLEKYYKERENGYHPECEPLCVSEAAEMLPASLDEITRWKKIALRQAKRSVGFKLASRRHRDTIDAQAKCITELEGLPREGLFGKYIIQKADGSVIDPNADYFVLRLDNDPIARRAALEYSYYLVSHAEDIRLAKELQGRIAKYNPKLEDCISLQYVGLQKSDLVLRYEGQAKRVADLEQKLLTSECRERGAGERIAELEKALVEERAWGEYNAEIQGIRQDPPYQDVAREWQRIARQQLHQERLL